MTTAIGGPVVGLVALGCATLCLAVPTTAAGTTKVTARPLHNGRISPMLYGSFVELLDDLVPGMWAEMLNDRSFEGLTKPSNWCYYDGQPNFCDREWHANPTWTHDTADSFNGARCAKLTASADSPAAVSQPDLAVTKHANYLFSGRFRASGAGLHSRAVLKTMLPNGKWMELAAVKLPNLSKKWTKCSVAMVSSGTTDRAVFELQLTGNGALWADKLSLMPSDNVHGWRKDVVRAIKEMRPGIVRWGGSACDPGGYRWKEGIGDRDRRVPFPNKVWGRIDSNDVGIDEFCQFCELVEAEPLVCLSFSDGPQSAADLVQYCNGEVTTTWGALRAANGHPKPYRVRYWQLGNELGGAGYAQDCVQFCRAMKQADASVSLLSSFPSQDLLDRVGGDIAYVGPHHYTPDLAACETDFRNLSEMIQKTPGCDHIRIAVTEWNVTGGSWGLGRAKLLTLDCAIQNARYLNLLMRYSKIVDIACRSNMTNSLCSGVIETRPAGLMRRPSYYAMRLYAEHSKPIPHGVEGAPEGIDLAACASEDGKRLCVFAVNTRTEPAELTLDLSEFGTGFRPLNGEVVCDTEDRHQPDVTNHWAAPDRVRTGELRVSAGKVALPALSASAIECGDSR